MEAARERGDRIGLLLDLDQGSMTMFKNGRRLGVMATGLSGEYCWAALLGWGSAVRIGAGRAPASPTVAELELQLRYQALPEDDRGRDEYCVRDDY
jgi:hypothetical protein